MSLAMWFTLGGDASLVVGVVIVRVVTPISTTLNPESILESIEITGFNSSGLPIQQSQTSSIANQSMLSPERPRLI